MKLLKALFITLFMNWVLIVVISFLFTPYVSGSTEEKYLRNIDKYRMINDHHFYIGLQDGDTLTDIAHTPFSEINPFQEWYILDVGGIKPYGKLSKKLDSLAALYIDPVNKLK